MTTLRFGTVGTSMITDQFINAGKHTEGFMLSGVHSRSKEKAQAYAKQHGARLYFTDVAQMAAHPEIDIVYIGSPNSLHYEQMRSVIKFGKHILCEKPFTSNAKEAFQIIQEVDKAGFFLMEMFKPTLSNNFILLQNALPQLGTIRSYVGNFCKISSRYQELLGGALPNIFNPAFGGGSMMDLGVYPLGVCIHLFGIPKTIQAQGIKLNSGVDGTASIFLKYPNMEAVIKSSKITTSFAPSEIQGEQASITIGAIATMEDIYLHKAGASSQRLDAATICHWNVAMQNEIAHAISYIRKGCKQSPTNTWQKTIDVMQVLDSAKKCLW